MEVKSGTDKMNVGRSLLIPFGGCVCSGINGFRIALRFIQFT